MFAVVFVCFVCVCCLCVCRVYVLLPLLCDVLFCWASTLLLCSNGCLCLFALFVFGFLLVVAWFVMCVVACVVVLFRIYVVCLCH